MSDSSKSARKYLRHKVTRKCNLVDQSLESLDSDDCAEILEFLKSSSAKLETFNENIYAEICKTEKDETKLGDILDECETYETQISVTCRKLSKKIASFSIPNSSNQPDLMHSHGNINKLKLPVLPLPTFSNRDGESLLQFFTNFEGILDKYSSADYRDTSGL